MDANKKRRQINIALYSVLAVSIALIIGITIFTGISRRAKPQEDLPSGDNTSSTNTPLDTPTSDNHSTSKDTQKIPKDSSTPDTSKQIDAPQVIPPVEDTDVSAPAREYQMPVSGYISKTFSTDALVFSMTMNDYRTHTGVDIHASTGSPVYAFCDGTISNIYQDPLMGTCICMDHEDGIKSYYMGLSEEIPEGIIEGKSVTCGEIIAAVGETSLIEIADSPHLHFEVTCNGEIVDPLNYFEYDGTVPTGVLYEDEN